MAAVLLRSMILENLINKMPWRKMILKRRKMLIKMIAFQLIARLWGRIQEKQIDVQAEDASVERGDGDDDTTKLLEKESNKERNRQEETKDKSYYEAEACEERKRKNF